MYPLAAHTLDGSVSFPVLSIFSFSHFSRFRFLLLDFVLDMLDMLACNIHKHSQNLQFVRGSSLYAVLVRTPS